MKREIVATLFVIWTLANVYISKHIDSEKGKEVFTNINLDVSEKLKVLSKYNTEK